MPTPLTSLHLIDQASPQAEPLTLALLAGTVARAQAAGESSQAWLLGSTPLRLAAKAAGLEPARLIPAPYGQAALAGWQLARHLPTGRDATQLHAWSLGTAWAMAMFRPRLPRTLHLTGPLSSAEASSLRRLARLPGVAPTRVQTLDASVGTALEQAGVPATQIECAPPQIVPAAVPAWTHSRAELREAWDVAPETHVIALLPARRADAYQATVAAGVAQLALHGRAAEPAMGDPATLRLLMHPAHARRRMAEEMLTKTGQAALIVQEPALAAPWQVLHACDALLVVPGSALPLAWAAASGLPVIAALPEGHAPDAPPPSAHPQVTWVAPTSRAIARAIGTLVAHEMV